MCKAEEELKAILDLLAEWRRKYGASYVTVNILPEGKGLAYARDNEKHLYDALGDYEPRDGNKEKGPAAATAEAQTK